MSVKLSCYTARKCAYGLEKRDLIFGSDPACPVHRVSTELLQSLHELECAIVFQVPEPIVQLVTCLREQLPADASRREQLTPHVTMVHLGVQDADSISKLSTALLCSFNLDACFDGYGLFQTTNGLQNLHVRLAPQSSFAAAQHVLISATAGLRTERLSKYVGKDFVPHITLWDQLAPDSWLTRIADLPDLPKQAFRLSELILIGRLSENYAL
jgi:2'-5' RNA ligase